jgi:hypothetical protein
MNSRFAGSAALVVAMMVFFAAPLAQAQISFTRADIESEIGQTYSPLSYQASTGQTTGIQTLLGMRGASQTWDFTSLSFDAATGATTTQEYVALPDNSLPGSTDPRVSAATFAVRTIDSTAPAGDMSVVYLGISDTEYNTYGTWAINNGAPNDLLYDSALLSYSLPLAFGSTFSGQTSYQQTTGGFTTDITIARDGEGTGWGTLVLPTGSYQALRYDVTVTTTTTVFGFATAVVSTITTFATKDGVSAGITVTQSVQGDIVTASYAVNNPNQGSVDPPSSAPASLTPAGGSTVSTDPMLDWGDVADATAYDLQVATGTFGKNTPDQVIVDETGLTSSSYQVNGLSNSTTYFWRVRATNAGGASDWTSSASFQTEAAAVVLPGAVTLTAPTDAATGVSTSPTLDWEAASDAATYDVQVSTDAGFGSTVLDQTGVADTQLAASGLSNSTTYFWRVRGVNADGNGEWSSASFTTEAAALVLPGAVALTAPADAATGVSTSPTLDWEAASDAATYDVQVSTDAGFGSTVLDQTGVTDTQLAASGLSNSTTYFWRVRGVNADGNGEWSSASFTTEAAALVLPGAVTLTAPAEGAIDVFAAPTLDWEAASDAVSYDVQVSTEATFASTVLDQSGVTDTQLAVSGLAHLTTYFWRVRGVNADGNGEWSSASFTTEAAALVLPGAVTLTAPAEGAIDVFAAPTLDWEAASDAVSYDVQVSTEATFASTVLDQSGVTDTQLAVSGLAHLTTYFWRVRGVNADGNGEWSSASFTTITNVSVEQVGDELPSAFQLHGAYPNPFNPQTTIRFDLDAATHVSLSIWDASGRMVDTLVDGSMSPGQYSYRWDASARNSGLYLIRVVAGDQVKSATVMLVK